MDLVMMNCELINLLYCMLLENEYLQSKAKRLHVKWINEAQCNWKKLWVFDGDLNFKVKFKL